MASKAQKKRNKKYDSNKSFKYRIKNAVFIHFVSESEGGENICVTNIASPELRNKVVTLKSDWSVQIGAICRDDGEYYCKESHILAKDKRINDLQNSFEEEKEELYSLVNENHLIDFGWVIRPYSQSLKTKIDNGTEKTMLDYWFDRKAIFERKALESLEA